MFSDKCKKAIETHCHTLGGSPCGKISAEKAVKAYKEAGYDAIILTNHFNDNTVPKPGLSVRECAERYVDLYKKAKEHGEKYGIEVWFGIETYLNGGSADFLIFGAEPDIVYENPEMYNMTQKELFKECEQYGCLLYQAHPFRSYCKPHNPNYLHGVEVYNGNARHDSHNDLALQWSEEHHLLKSAGSDFHQMEDLARGGILVPDTIGDIKALAEYMRNNEVELITTN